jgi:hypothetical protein
LQEIITTSVQGTYKWCRKFTKEIDLKKLAKFNILGQYLKKIYSFILHKAVVLQLLKFNELSYNIDEGDQAGARTKTFW